MTEELRHYAVIWSDAKIPSWKSRRSVVVRAADMRDAVTLFEREGEDLSQHTWEKGERYKIRAITKDSCPFCCGEGKWVANSAFLVPGETCIDCGGTGKMRTT